jgi:hypothetical protein
MSLTQFTLSDQVNLQQILRLSPYEVAPHSDLYSRLEKVEVMDGELGTDKVGFIQALIVDVLSLNESIKAMRQDETYGLKSADIGRISFESSDQKSPDQGLIKQKESLITQLKNELYYSSVSPHGIIPVDGVTDGRLEDDYFLELRPL